MKALSLILIFISFDSFACKPRADFIAPTIAENYKNAAIVFAGKVMSVKELGRSREPFGMKNQIEFSLVKNIKSAKSKKITLFSYSNTCDTFAQNVSINSYCLIFASQDQLIFAGVLSGESSFCGNSKIIDQKIRELESLK